MAPYNTPQAIRPLEKTICDFAYSNGYDPISVFNDFLRYVIHGFSPGAPPLMDWKYKRQQNRHFMEMLTGWIRLMQRELQSGGWFDAFGDLFMAISSKIGRQVNGQFFTPPDICDLMVLCTDSMPFSRYSAKLVRTCAEARSTATFAISASTIIFTSCSKEVFRGFHPSSRLAFDGSPQRLTTSVGR